MRRRVLSVAFFVALLNSRIGAEESVQTDWGRAQVAVRREDGRRIVAGQRHTVIVHPDTLALQVKDQSVTWGLEGSTEGDLLVEHKGAEHVPASGRRQEGGRHFLRHGIHGPREDRVERLSAR